MRPAPGQIASLAAAAVAALAMCAVIVAAPHAPVALPAEAPDVVQADEAGKPSTDADDLDERGLAQLARTASRPAKLQDADETVDAHGVVHGTTEGGVRYTVHGRGTTADSPNRVTLAAVGDQIASDNALVIADGNAGDYDDGLYDFNPWYAETGPFIRNCDLRFINQETVMANGPELGGPSGYPSFNSPDACAQAISDQGFNLVNFATNHIYDYWTEGIEASHVLWQRYPQLVVAGSYLSQEARETVQMVERNGITFAFLAYAYGDNRFGGGEWIAPNDYYDCFFDEELMAADIARAKQVADVVIVAMHWGTEYDPEPNDEQRQWAQWLADQDVDLVLGTHAHTIQPIEYYTGAGGKQVPVVFGLSDFISGWEVTNTLVSGVFTCDFVPDGQTGHRVSNLVWHPTIEWSDGQRTYVRFLAGMTPDEMNANTLCADVDDVYEHVRELVGRTIVDVPVDWSAVEQPSKHEEGE